MNTIESKYLCFTLGDGREITVDGFVMERSENVVLAVYEFDESEDETIARHLLKARRLWDGSPEPSLVLPPVPTRYGGLPPYVITAWLRSGRQRIVVVVFVEVQPVSITDMLEMHLRHIHWEILVNNVDREEDRRLFNWYQH